MNGFVKICTKAELPGEGQAKEFAAPGGRALCVANVGGEITAMDNECPHNGGPLAEGWIEEGKVICPWHTWAFDRHTGVADHSPGTRVPVYEVKVEDGDVLAKVS